MSRHTERIGQILVRMEALSIERTSEEGHIEADDLLVEAINLIGNPNLKAIAKHYEEVGKWYA